MSRVIPFRNVIALEYVAVAQRVGDAPQFPPLQVATLKCGHIQLGKWVDPPKGFHCHDCW